MTIELTKEQKDCVEYPLDKQILLIDADPGTGKTEILRHRVKFIYQQNEKQRKFILILAVGRNISLSIKRKLKEEGLKKIHRQLKTVLPEFIHELCKQTDCWECESRTRPIILACTVHSLAYWIIKQVFTKQLKEKKKIQILTNAWNKDLSLIYQNPNHPQLKEKIQWTVKEVIARKRRIFSYLLNKITSEKLTKESKRKLWAIFRQEVEVTRENHPYYHWEIINYSGFLTAAKKLFPENELSAYQELENACLTDHEKNVWLSFDDMIDNVLLFMQKQNDKPHYWPIFDYILVDECQDLKLNLLTLITKIFSHKKTNFTFVGDPKQNIMAFAGATEDVFQLLRKEFPHCIQMEIAISFRVPQEVATMANDFTSKFMPYKPKLTTNQTNGGKKPVIFLSGKDKDYQLSIEEKNSLNKKIELIAKEEKWFELSSQEREKKLQKKQNDLASEEIKAKKLKSQVNFILSIINNLDKSTSRAILYRKNETGNWLKNWFVATNYYDFTMAGDDFGRAIKHIVNKIKKELKEKSFSISKFKSIEDFLNNLGINWRNIPQLQQIIDKFEQERFLSEENQNLDEGEVSDFIIQIEKQLIEKDLENTGKTVLSTIHKAKGLEFDYVFLIAVDEEILPNENNDRAWEEVNLFYTAITRTKKELYLTASCPKECSRFIRNLDPNLIELAPSGLQQPLLSEDDVNYPHPFFPYSSISEMIGEKGETEVRKLLTDHKKLKFEKLNKNWKEIEELQIDIYAETAKNVYFIEVKNWSESFYHSPKGTFHQEKIWKQQIWRKEKITNNFETSKTIVYLITFPSGELANDFQGFLTKKQDQELLVVHHDQVHGKVWEDAYNLKRIDEFIYEKEKAFRSRKLKMPNPSLMKMTNREKVKNDY